MPDEAVFGERTWAMLAMLPPRLAESTDYRALIHAQAREVELLEQRIGEMRAQFNPLTADTLLKAWEALVHLDPEPAGATLDARRAAVVALLRAIVPDPRGSVWEAALGSYLGAGWDYTEHVPGDTDPPPEGTLRIVLPVPVSSPLWDRYEQLVRARTPPHLALQFVSLYGFLWDHSEFDVDHWD